MEKIIFDTDPGIDDAMALLLIHSLNALDVVGITTVFGNASIDTCTRNALYMCERFDLSYPVYRGAGRTIEGEDETDFPDFVHGKMVWAISKLARFTSRSKSLMRPLLSSSPPSKRAT